MCLPRQKAVSMQRHLTALARASSLTEQITFEKICSLPRLSFPTSQSSRDNTYLLRAL